MPATSADRGRARVGKREFSAFDSEGLSKLLADDGQVVAMTVEARSRGMQAVVSALAIIEAVHARTHKARLNWVLSGLRVIPVGEEEARAASKLLMNAGLHGHKYAINAAVAEAGAPPASPRGHVDLRHRRHGQALRRPYPACGGVTPATAIPVGECTPTWPGSRGFMIKP